MDNLSHYLIPINQIDIRAILKTWTWLIHEDKTLVALTKMGDMLVCDYNHNLYHLDTGLGELTLVCANYPDFLDGKLTEDAYEEVTLPGLVDQLESLQKRLKINQVYSYYKLPLIGGLYEADNIYCLNIYEHYGMTGKIHLQLRDLPDGSKVDIKWV